MFTLINVTNCNTCYEHVYPLYVHCMIACLFMLGIETVKYQLADHKIKGLKALKITGLVGYKCLF